MLSLTSRKETLQQVPASIFPHGLLLCHAVRFGFDSIPTGYTIVIVKYVLRGTYTNRLLPPIPDCCISSMSLGTSAAIISEFPGLRGPEHKGFWEEYLKKVTDEDIRLTTRWQKILDTLLVYVGLFIGVLTAFIIQLSSVFQPNPGNATNKILIAIYNDTMNASSRPPIDLQQYITWDKSFNSTVSGNIFLLYTSLALSVTEAAGALIISIWLTRYQRSLTEAGPTVHERIRKRHEAYRGLMDWKIPILIETLPMVAVVALVFFGVFIRDSILGVNPTTSNTLNSIFLTAALLFVLTASFAAFLPGAPFHSPLSGFFNLIFQIFPNRTIRGPITIRIFFVAVICVASPAAFFTVYKQTPWICRILLLFLIPVSLLSLCQRTQAEKEMQEKPKPQLFCLATWLYSHSVVIIILFLTAMYASSLGLRIAFLSLTGIVLLVMTKGARQMSQWTPDEDTAMAEALAWMIKTQASHNLVAMQDAVEIGRKYAHLRSTLLKDILPVLDVLIKFIRGDREQDLKDDEKTYITLLAILVDFEPSEAVYWRNEAAVKPPVLSDGLKEKLRSLSKGCSVHSSSQASGCTTAEAKSILRKVGEADSVEKGAWVDSHVV